jgi:CHAT domain-containing protein
MAAFVEGKLRPEEIAVVAAHLVECPDCRTVISETARLEREERPAAPVSSRRWPLWLAVAAIMAVVFAAVPLIVHRMPSRVPDTPGREWTGPLIAAAPADHRLVEGRLSGFPWARLDVPMRGNLALGPADLQLAGAAGGVLAKAGRRTNPEAQHAAGVAYLVIGRRAEGIAALERAARGSADARAWNDLAAARMAAAAQDRQFSQLPQALTEVEHALRLEPGNPEAHFNRALIVEHMGLRDQARKAWQDYLQVDGSSNWSVEARSHLRALQTTTRRFDPQRFEQMPAGSLVREFPQQARTFGEGALLSQWADAEDEQDAARAATILTRTHTLAEALAVSNGEHLLQDAVAAIEHSSGVGRTSLIRGHRVYRDGRVDYSKRRLAVAEENLRRAAQLLEGSPMALVADYYAASAAFDQNRRDEAQEQLVRLLAKVDPGRYRALAAQIHWELAVCANAAGDWGAAIREADAAAALFHSLGEGLSEAKVDCVGAMALELIGESDPAWDRRMRSLALLSIAGESQKIGAVLHNAAATLAATGHPGAAASVIALIVAPEGTAADPAQLSFNGADGARFTALAGDPVRARQELARARLAAAAVSDSSLRETVDRQIDLADAAIRGTGEARLAMASLDRAVSYLARRQQGGVDLAEAYLQRARNERALGDTAKALADLASAFGAVETQQATISDAEGRLRFLDVAGQIVEEAIDLRLRSGDVAGALAAADRSHSLGMARAGAPPRRATGMRPAAGVAVVEYAVLPEEVVVFCLTADGVVARRMPIDRQELEDRVTSFVELVRQRAALASVHSSGAALHRLLIEPLSPVLGGITQLIVVPDRQLHALPFGALWDERRKEYLIERFTIRLAPYASAGAEATGPLQPALIVADPATSLRSPLPGGEDEAQQIAALHRGATLLTGEGATRAAFVDAAGRSALIHFAGHADSDTGHAYAALLLASHGTDPGVLGAGDVSRLRLTAHPLVVLAACGTFRGNLHHVAGMSSLGRAFLLAGARGVVGTLWEIEDDVSLPLFLRLHEELRSGSSPAAALRQAQVDLLRSTNPRLSHPAAWAPVELIINP